MKVVVESPLGGKTVEERRENLRYLLWCCRAVYLAGYRPIASHLVCPMFMDDTDQKERADGIDWPWMWEPGVVHWFFADMDTGGAGYSKGMRMSSDRCERFGIPWFTRTLRDDESCFEAWRRGEWPPNTFDLGAVL